MGALPYRDVPYAEDQLLGRELIEAGYAKVFHPEARVLHSHDYPPGQFFKRYFDEFRSLREVLGHVQPWGPRTTLWDVRGLVGADKRWLEQQGVSGLDLVPPLAVSTRHWAIRMAGAIAGTRADRLPSGLRRRLSLEGRETFVEHEVPESTLLDEDAAFDTDWPWEFVRREYPPRSVHVEPRPPRSSGPLTVSWVVPPWRVGSGGHTTIFRLIQQLEQRGHKCAVYVFDPFGWDERPGHELRDEIVEKFIPIQAPVFAGLDDFTPCDVCVATQWWTAWPVRDLPGCGEKVYLVQDDEPQFYATSTESIFAEETYRMGYRCIAYTPWMAEILVDKYGLESRYFECGTDLDTYRFGGRGRPRAGADRRLRAQGDRAARGRPGARRADGAVPAPAGHPRGRVRLERRARASRSRPRTGACGPRASSPSSTGARQRESSSRSPRTRWSPRR